MLTIANIEVDMGSVRESIQPHVENLLRTTFAEEFPEPHKLQLNFFTENELTVSEPEGMTLQKFVRQLLVVSHKLKKAGISIITTIAVGDDLIVLEHSTFMDLYLRDMVSADAFDDFLSAWHDIEPAHQEVYEYLGMTWEEYSQHIMRAPQSLEELKQHRLAS